MKPTPFRGLAAALAASLPLALPGIAQAGGDNDIKALRDELQQMRQTYEQRINALEQRLALAESTAGRAEQTAAQAQVAAAAPKSAATTPGAAFNPAISAVLSGMYTNQQRSPGNWRIGGFMPSQGEVAPPPRGFSLGESELSFEASIDPLLRGKLVFSLPPEEGASAAVEEAFIQTQNLSGGLNFRAGRFLSGIGYLNEQHAHAWDFSDAPLAYKAFLGNQLKNDGLQVRWLAPTETFIELGAEAARGGAFPATDRDKNGSGLGALFAHVGGDVGASHSWRAGLSYVSTAPRDRLDDSAAPSFAFSGDSRLIGADFILKWAPNGDASQQSFKLQGEYFRRREDGQLTPSGSAAEAYAASQSGWYLQGVWQFMPNWRLGYRYDRLDHGQVDNASVAAGAIPLLAPWDPKRNTLMVDWNPSEFSRIRLQYARDESTPGLTDNQWWLHYIVTLGAHGAHAY
ncbi:MAG TPA: TonB-dependent receptor [Rhodocyclaceae bacterium]